MKQYPRKPPRYGQDNALYFLTFCTFKRKRILLLPGVPEFLIEELIFYEKKIKELVAYTIMPDHIHLIVEIETAITLSNLLRDFKKHTSKEISKRLLLRGEPVWQPGTMDHCIRFSWENQDYMNHLSYLFYNSSKHLKIAPNDFRYHNFKSFVEEGKLDSDFCTFDKEREKRFEMYE